MATKILSVSNQDLLNKADFSSLKADISSGSGTLSLYSITSFSINDILLIGEFGQEGSEIVAVHASTAPTGNTVTLASNLVKSHPKDTRVSIVLFDKVDILTAPTADGAKTAVSGSPFNLDAEKSETTYVGMATSGGYFMRWYNSVSNTYSDYSDFIPYGGFGSNTVSYIIDLALSETNKAFSDKLTYQMLVSEINACLRHVRGKLKSWSNVQAFDQTIDQMDRGEYQFSIPSDYYDPNSNRSMLDVRVGDKPLTFIDKDELNQIMSDTHLTTVATQALAGDTTLALTSASDYADTGVVHVYSGTNRYTITYTAKSGNTLTGVPASGDGSITATLAVGLNVWQGEYEGNPENFTVADGYLYIWPLINSTDAGFNIEADYYTEIVEVNSDSDEITLARFDMVKYWLKWMIRNIAERNGKPDFTDGDWLMFNGALSDAIRRESSGQKRKSKPKVNRISYPRTKG